MRPGTSELTRTSWFGSAATVPVIVIQEVMPPRATLVTVTVASCCGVFPSPSFASPPVFDEQAHASATAKAEAPRIIRDARSEERRVGKSVDLGGRRIIKKKKKRKSS